MFRPGIANIPSNASGTAPASSGDPDGTTVTFMKGDNKTNKATICVVVSNLEAVGGNALEISFVKGGGWFSIPGATSIAIPVLCQACYVRGAGSSSAAFSLMGIV
jgi:hypothetical protein